MCTDCLVAPATLPGNFVALINHGNKQLLPVLGSPVLVPLIWDSCGSLVHLAVVGKSQQDI